MHALREGSFRWPVRVYYEDTDTGGIVFYANYLKFFERARTEWLRAAGIGQQALAVKENILFVVRSAHVDYHAAARLDDELTISVEVERLGRATVNFLQQAWRMQDDTAVLLCSASIKVGCVGTPSLRPTAMPDATLAKIRARHDFFQKK